MKFHAEFFPPLLPQKITHHDKLLLIGSCFTEQIGNKLAAHKFKILQNPNGILFNPVSIANALNAYCAGKEYKEKDLFYQNELWASWQHHSLYSHPEKEIVLKRINSAGTNAANFIQDANWLMITLGSAFVYERKELLAENIYERVVANCHKIPNDTFLRRLLQPAEISQILKSSIANVHSINPDVKILFTISPVRHLREGFVENNRSKAALIQAVHEIANNENIFYFPAYELVIDDLRDYRFYAEDLVHPNYAATNYVWEKFVAATMNENTISLMKQINEINAAVAHKPFNENSNAHQNFRKSYLEKARVFQSVNQEIDLKKEIEFFS